MSFLIFRLLACWLQLLLQPCPSARPGVARARRLRTRNAEAPHEGAPFLRGYVGDAAFRVWMPCPREGRHPLETQKWKNGRMGGAQRSHSPAPRPVIRAAAGA